MSFFAEHPLFLGTSHVGVYPERLRLRHRAIIEANAHVFQGASVLDLASHDGRWSLAALKAGAAHVTGIEARPHLVDAAHANLRAYGVPPSTYRFLVGDLNQPQEFGEDFDVVLCLGYFYHTLNHVSLLEMIATSGAQHAIFDTMVERSAETIISVRAEPIEHDANGIGDLGIKDGQILVGFPSPSALGLMLRHYGFEVAFYDWPKLLKDEHVPPQVGEWSSAAYPVADYACGARMTLLASRVRAG